METRVIQGSRFDSKVGFLFGSDLPLRKYISPSVPPSQ